MNSVRKGWAKSTYAHIAMYVSAEMMRTQHEWRICCLRYRECSWWLQSDWQRHQCPHPQVYRLERHDSKSTIRTLPCIDYDNTGPRSQRTCLEECSRRGQLLVNRTRDPNIVHFEERYNDEGNCSLGHEGDPWWGIDCGRECRRACRVTSIKTHVFNEFDRSHKFRPRKRDPNVVTIKIELPKVVHRTRLRRTSKEEVVENVLKLYSALFFTCLVLSICAIYKCYFKTKKFFSNQISNYEV